ncbi:MAG: lipopolysaccharide kinase InaA family protein [Cellvibrionaceae bacterium]
MKAVTLELLAQAGREPELPLSITLPDGELVIEQWLRVLPAKRYVARARMGQNTRLVKLFVGPRAEKKAREEAAAIERLASKGIPTPLLIGVGATSGKGAWLFTEYFEGCETLAVKAQLSVSAISNRQEIPKAAYDAVQTLAILHNSDLIHQDIHPGNILFYREQCWIIDAADTSAAEGAQNKGENLGLFLAQLHQHWWSSLVEGYNRIAASSLDYGTVCAHAQRWQAKRAADLSEKSVRDCSLFRVQQSMGEFCAVWREESGWLAPILKDLDQALASSTILKDGASATVGLIEVAGRKLVIKRYNIKSFWHGLKRFWRPTRAWISWQAGIRLRVLGIHTPKPLALKEERLGPFRRRGYLLVEANEGLDLLDLIQSDDGNNSEQGGQSLLPRVTQDIEQLLTIMSQHQISHGDFKATNLLWDEQLCVIDLDSICWHKKQSSWQKAFAKDKARLLRNWKPNSQPYEHFKKVLNS